MDFVRKLSGQMENHHNVQCAVSISIDQRLTIVFSLHRCQQQGYRQTVSQSHVQDSQVQHSHCKHQPSRICQNDVDSVARLESFRAL